MYIMTAINPAKLLIRDVHNSHFVMSGASHNHHCLDYAEILQSYRSHMGLCMSLTYEKSVLWKTYIQM